MEDFKEDLLKGDLAWFLSGEGESWFLVDLNPDFLNWLSDLNLKASTLSLLFKIDLTCSSSRVSLSNSSTIYHKEINIILFFLNVYLGILSGDTIDISSASIQIRLELEVIIEEIGVRVLEVILVSL